MKRRVGKRGMTAVLLAASAAFLAGLVCLSMWGEGEEASGQAESVELRSIIVAEGDGALPDPAGESQSPEGGDLSQPRPSGGAGEVSPEPDIPPSGDSTAPPQALPSPSAGPAASGEGVHEDGEQEAETGTVPDDGGEEAPSQGTARPEGIDPPPAAPDGDEEETLPGGAAPDPAPTEEPEERKEAQEEGGGVSAGTAPADTPGHTEAPDAVSGLKYKVTYYLPYIALSYDVDGVVYSDIREVEPSVYKNVDVDSGAALDRPWNPIVFMTPLGYTTSKADISFEGWCTADGAEWNFEQNVVQGDTELYPVWVDSSGKRYYTVIYSAPEAGYYCCNCLSEGSAGYERPAGLEGYSAPQRNGYLLAGWEKKNQGNAIWGAGTEVVDGFECLNAIWLPLETSAYVAAYTTATWENGTGDLVDLFLVEPGERCPAPARPLSDGIILPEGAQGQPVDWLNEGGSYRETIVEGGERFYTFRAVWGMQGE